MRAWALMALVLAAVVAAGTGPALANDTGWCAQSFGEVKVGTGPAPIELPVPLLAGISYVDVPFHSCSGGGFWIDSKSGDVQGTRLCSEEVVRVWGTTGQAGQNYIIDWKPHGQDDCP